MTSFSIKSLLVLLCLTAPAFAQVKDNELKGNEKLYIEVQGNYLDYKYFIVGPETRMILSEDMGSDLRKRKAVATNILSQLRLVKATFAQTLSQTYPTEADAIKAGETLGESLKSVIIAYENKVVLEDVKVTRNAMSSGVSFFDTYTLKMEELLQEVDNIKNRSIKSAFWKAITAKHPRLIDTEAVALQVSKVSTYFQTRQCHTALQSLEK